MPTSFEIPSRRERHCEPCEFHKNDRGAIGPTRQYVATIFDADVFEKLSIDPEIAAKQGALRDRIKKHGRDIGKTEIQPEWCPLRKGTNHEH